MQIIYQITKDDLFAFIEEISATLAKKSVTEQKNNETYLTCIKDIQKHFNCSQGKAQNIKNKIPKENYWQDGRKFRIPLSIILKVGNE